MSRFNLTGVILEDVQIKVFGSNNAVSKKIRIQEAPKSNQANAYTYEVEFNGRYSSQIPDNIDLKGSEVMVIGSMITMTSKNGNPIVFLKGENMLIISFPQFEEEIDNNTGDTVTYIAPPENRYGNDDEDDLPF